MLKIRDSKNPALQRHHGSQFQRRGCPLTGMRCCGYGETLFWKLPSISIYLAICLSGLSAWQLCTAIRIKFFEKRGDSRVWNKRAKDTRKEGKPRLSKDGTSLVAQWLILHASNAGGPNSIPGQETRPHMLQRKSLQATAKTLHSQMDKLIIITVKASTKSLALRSDTVVKWNTSRKSIWGAQERTVAPPPWPRPAQSGGARDSSLDTGSEVKPVKWDPTAPGLPTHPPDGSIRVLICSPHAAWLFLEACHPLFNIQKAVHN